MRLITKLNFIFFLLQRMKRGRNETRWTSGVTWSSPVRRRRASVLCWTAWPPTISAARTQTWSISSTTSSGRRNCQRRRPSSYSTTLFALWRTYIRYYVFYYRHCKKPKDFFINVDWYWLEYWVWKNFSLKDGSVDIL